ncbi:MAG TPA: DUF1028 domain-containing protein [Candidatus Sulfotelmatobacter sp.]|nr:DUF1028 domain-containing protein [Candidatus Sulfotelmatobacter sp.]
MSNSALLKSLVSLCATLLLCVPCARATYSIIACNPTTRECGVAVQTNNLAVGASVPYAQAGVGALASHFETNPNYGPRGLALLAQGVAPADALQRLLSEDGNFEGQGPGSRQVAIVSLDGRTAVHTGNEVQNASWAGARSGFGYSIQGNGLTSGQVVDAMEQAFLHTAGTLAERLLTALIAGDRAGGQKTGRESAALLVKTPHGWPVDIDLRVDHSADPVSDLRTLLNMQLARQQVAQASRAAKDGRLDAAEALLISAVARASNWQRILLQGARVAADIERPALALQYLNVAFSQNNAWTESEIGDGYYASLGHDPLFHKWVRPENEQAALAEFQAIGKSKDVSPDKRLQVAGRLLEADHATEALALLAPLSTATAEQEVQIASLLTDAYAAEGEFHKAVEHCQSGLKFDPRNQRLQRKLARLETVFPK